MAPERNEVVCRVKLGLVFLQINFKAALDIFSHDFLYKILIKVKEVRSIYCESDKYLSWLKVILFL